MSNAHCCRRGSAGLFGGGGVANAGSTCTALAVLCRAAVSLLRSVVWRVRSKPTAWLQRNA
eukprot:COSAG06_NODE_2289_length_7148_cov_2.086679_12_plen_61_part_00